MDNAFLDLPLEDEDSLLNLHAAYVSYRIAVGKDAGKKVFTLHSLPVKDDDHYGQLAQINGFSMHAATSCREIFADNPAVIHKILVYLDKQTLLGAKTDHHLNM